METLRGFVSALGTRHPPCLPPRFARPRQTRGTCPPPRRPLATLGRARWFARARGRERSERGQGLGV